MKIFLILFVLTSLISSLPAQSQLLSRDKSRFRSSDLWDFIKSTRGPSLEQDMFHQLTLAYQKWPQFTDPEWEQVLSYVRKYGPAQFSGELHMLWVSQSQSRSPAQRFKVAEALMEAGRFSEVLEWHSGNPESSPHQEDLKLLRVEAALLGGQVELSLELVSKLLSLGQHEKMSRRQKIYAHLLNSWILHLQGVPLKSLASLERARYLWRLKPPQPEYFRLALLMSSLDFLRREFALIPAQLSPFLDLDSANPLDLFRARALIQASLLLSLRSSNLEKEFHPMISLFQRGLQYESAYIRFGFLDAVSNYSASRAPEEMIRIAKARLEELKRLRSSRSIEVLVDQSVLDSVSSLEGLQNKKAQPKLSL